MAVNFLKIRSGLTLKPNAAPATPENGDVYYDSGTNLFNFYQNGTLINIPTSYAGTVGSFNGQTASANGLVISGTSIFAQSASASNPGMVDTTTQTMAGAKTFSTSVASPSILINGATSGAVTMNTVGTVSSYTMTWPSTQTSGLLQNNGTGTLSWVTALSGSSFRAGSTSISNASTSQAVTFSSALASTSYGVVAVISNVTDTNPEYFPVTVTTIATTGFTAKWNAPTDSANYVLQWIVFLNN